jgi:DNA-binding response OmpR family regulator
VAGVNILLIDDEQRLLDALAVAFRFRWPDADILTATDAETGLGLALARAPDLVVLDVGLPDRSGFDVLADLRRASDVPVIMLTAARDEMDHVRGLELGADDYLAKPVGSMALLAHIRAVLRRAQPLADPGQTAGLTVGDLRLHELRREVMVSGQRVRLTALEFRLLHCLMRNAGHVVNRSTLIRRVWGDEDGATDHDLSVVVGRVRAKIASAGAPQAILTERGIGYRVVAP